MPGRNVWMRSLVAVVAAVASAGASVPVARGAQGPSVATVVSTRQVGRIPPGFLGLSWELRAIENDTGFNPRGVDPVLEQLIRNLTPGQRPVLRLGGDTSDWTWAPIPYARRPIGIRYALTPRWFEVVRSLAASLDARLIVGVGLEVDRARVAAAEARAIIAGIGSRWLDALELGNEPDLYTVVPWFVSHGVAQFARSPGWSFAAYLRDFAGIARALPSFPLAGPDAGIAPYVAGFGQFLAAEPRVRIATVHWYPLGCIPSAPATISNLLSDASTQGAGSVLAPALAAARARGIPLRVDEINTVSCGGQIGVSNTFAAALWALDVSFELASRGFAGVNIHTRVSPANQLFGFRRAGGVWSGHVAPEYYGLLAFARAAPRGSRLLDVAGVPGGRVRVWATRAPDGTERVVLINLATRAGRTVTVRAGAPGRAATLERLSAAGIGATGGITLGGQSFGSGTRTGLLTGRPRVTSLGGSPYRVWLPAASAAILTLG